MHMDSGRMVDLMPDTNRGRAPAQSRILINTADPVINTNFHKLHFLTCIVEDSLTVKDCIGLLHISCFLLVDNFNSGLGHRKGKTTGVVEEGDSYYTIRRPSKNLY